MSEEKHALVCARVVDLKHSTPGSIQTACVRCGAAVWVSRSGQQALSQREHAVMCIQCAGRAAGDKQVEVQLAPGALEELLAYNNRN